MITHVVVFRWRSAIPPGQLQVVAAALDELPAAVPSIRSYRHGPDVGIAASTNCDYATFDDADGWREHDEHPVHVAARADVIAPWVAARAAVQFAD